MAKSKFIIAALCLSIFLCNSVYSQKNTENSAKITGKIENYLDRIEKLGFSGSVLVEIDGRKALSKGYGFRNVEQKLENTPETVFDIGSITKQFTAAAILKLEMQGKLATGDKITKYFDDVPEDKAEITIHDLLRHQAGLPSVVGGDFDPITESVFIEKVFSAPLKFKNGTKFSYSNVGYSLLGIIIEKASGMSYEQFLYQNIWKPAGMESTGYTRPKFDNDLIAVGYEGDRNWGRPTDKKWDQDAPYWHLKSNGGILSTAEDLYKWHSALLSDRILSNQAKQKYFAPELRLDETGEGYYAYGWDVHQTVRNTIVIQHNGTNRIFYADFRRFVDENVAVIMLLNKAEPSLNEVTFVIADIIFKPSFKPAVPIIENRANRLFTEEVIKITLDKGLPEGIKYYQSKDGQTGLLERLVNARGYELISTKEFVKAIDLFKFNVYVFDKSANAYDSLGEAYYLNENYDLALINYKKSLELDARNNNAKQVIKEIEDILKNGKNR